MSNEKPDPEEVADRLRGYQNVCSESQQKAFIAMAKLMSMYRTLHKPLIPMENLWVKDGDTDDD